MGDWSETKKIVLIAMILVVSTISMVVLSSFTGSVFAVHDNVTVIVNISSLSQVEVIPDLLNWTQCDPGTDCGNKNIDVKNTGSIDLTNVYSSTNTTEGESSNPLGGAVTGYSSAGLIALANDTNATFLFVGRLEWNLTAPPALYLPRPITGVTNKSWGWFRNVSDNYMWELINGTNDDEISINCSSPGTILTVAFGVDNGTAASRVPNVNGSIATADGAEWASFTFTTGPWQHYCVATYYDCTKILLYKYDYNSDYPACASRKYNAAVITPGDSKLWNVRAWVPEGIPSSELAPGTLTITAT